MAGTATAAACGTFVALDARGGIPTAQGQVGACQRLECSHNNDLLCTAGEIGIAGDAALCTKFEVR